MWLADQSSSLDQREIVVKLAASIAEEYRDVVNEARAVGEDPSVQRRTLARLRRELARIRQRDYFPPPERDEAARAVEDLASRTETVS